ncbi:MAG: hypothetical protein NTY35_08680 [Planctomycetota bacterium]|nr:hypothetical protein [Planctomycetota bacterium]
MSTRRAPPACIAVDWSGALTGERNRIWIAKTRAGPTDAAEKNRAARGTDTASTTSDRATRAATDGVPRALPGVRLTRLECGRDRSEVIAELIATARRDPRVVVGLDFAFSGPAWFLRRLGVTSARALWERVARDGERWLAESPHPFWGKPGVRCPAFDDAHSAWRATESDAVRERGIGPKSVFQIGGAGSVGTGSLRGMPYLRDLQDAGFAIWPFDPPRLPMAVEIYPRQLTGPVNKSSRVARALYLQARFADQPDAFLRAAESSEDAFDAAVSALRMQRCARQLLKGPVAYLPSDELEGRIWRPARDVVVERCT